jgi:hypothetical protein
VDTLGEIGADTGGGVSVRFSVGSGGGASRLHALSIPTMRNRARILPHTVIALLPAAAR